MPKLTWDQVGDRVYETGLDRGVLFLLDGSAIPWNGLTSVIEKNEKEKSAVYYEGVKINEFIYPGDFAATLKAITFPDEMLELEGYQELRNGVYFGEQPPDLFNLCYRTRIGDDLSGDEAGYKIHLAYNLTAIPSDVSHATGSDDPSLVEFEWDISSIPEEYPGFRPTAHIVIDSRKVDPWLLEMIEKKLYGAEFALPNLPSLSLFADFMKEWYRFKVTDNGDGTYTVVTGLDETLEFSGFNEEIFRLWGIQVVYLDEFTFRIVDTYDIADSPTIKITDNGDGTWTATSEQEGLIAVDEFGYFNIFNANAVYVAPDEYQLSDTTA